MKYCHFYTLPVHPLAIPLFVPFKKTNDATPRLLTTLHHMCMFSVSCGVMWFIRQMFIKWLLKYHLFIYYYYIILLINYILDNTAVFDHIQLAMTHVISLFVWLFVFFLVNFYSFQQITLSRYSIRFILTKSVLQDIFL